MKRKFRNAEPFESGCGAEPYARRPSASDWSLDG
jgi:hypothetical protein